MHGFSIVHMSAKLPSLFGVVVVFCCLFVCVFVFAGVEAFVFVWFFTAQKPYCSNPHFSCLLSSSYLTCSSKLAMAGRAWFSYSPTLMGQSVLCAEEKTTMHIFGFHMLWSWSSFFFMRSFCYGSLIYFITTV